MSRITISQDWMRKCETSDEGSMILAEFARQFWTKRLSCGAVYDKKNVRALFVERVMRIIRKTLRRYGNEHQYAFLALLHWQGIPQQKEIIIAEQSEYCSARCNANKRKRQVMDIERGSPPREGCRKLSSSAWERSLLPRGCLYTSSSSSLERNSRPWEGRQKLNFVVRTSFPRWVGMSTSEVITALKYGDFNLDDTISMDSTRL